MILNSVATLCMCQKSAARATGGTSARSCTPSLAHSNSIDRRFLSMRSRGDDVSPLCVASDRTNDSRFVDSWSSLSSTPNDANTISVDDA
jgi:hypothetical protein